MSNRPTIADLARAAGVSVATVDRVLNGRHPVREETARRVYEAAKSIGYHAVGLIRQRVFEDLPQYKLAFVLQKPEQSFYKAVAKEIESAALSLSNARVFAQIDFVGARELTKEQLSAGMRQIGIVEGRIFDRGLLDRAEQELKRLYLSQGYYAVTVSTTITPLERNRVSINFDIEEGQIAKIRQIRIIGAKAFPEKELLGQFVLRTPGLMTWYTKNDQYSRQKLSGDLEALRSYYLDRGYAEFAIDSTQVSITPDKQDIYITVNITEGQKYVVGDIKIAGEPLFRLLARRHGREADPRVFVYAAGGYYYPGKDLGALRAEMRSYLDRGYDVVKMKIGGAPLPEDLVRIDAVLAEIGPRARLAVDANGRFDLETAIAYARALRERPLFWFEEAGDPLDYRLQAVLSDHYPAPMATEAAIPTGRQVCGVALHLHHADLGASISDSTAARHRAIASSSVMAPVAAS